MQEDLRLALVIGNSRLHWAILSRQTIVSRWDTEHLERKVIDQHLAHKDPHAPLSRLIPQSVSDDTSIALPLLVASVVPQQTKQWQTYISIEVITLDSVPLGGMYPTMGIDRALAVLGAGESYQYPVLVIDGGTALTLTGVDSDRQIIGGAILPGLQLQGRSLTQQTATLPNIDFSIKPYPSKQSLLSTIDIPRWANTTHEAIRSGIIYTVLSGLRDFIDDWHHNYPSSLVLLTGGDGALLHHHIQHQYPHLHSATLFDSDLIFKGIQALLS